MLYFDVGDVQIESEKGRRTTRTSDLPHHSVSHSQSNYTRPPKHARNTSWVPPNYNPQPTIVVSHRIHKLLIVINAP
jgi:hypothetical protein